MNVSDLAGQYVLIKLNSGECFIGMVGKATENSVHIPAASQILDGVLNSLGRASKLLSEQEIKDAFLEITKANRFDRLFGEQGNYLFFIQNVTFVKLLNEEATANLALAERLYQLAAF